MATDTHSHPMTMASRPFVEIRQVRKVFGQSVAVDDVSLKIERNELFALLGSSGCGKSTLLRMLAGFETPTAGQILIDGEDISKLPPYQRPVNMMFQSYALFPHMNVENNIAYGLKKEGVRRDEIRRRVDEMLTLVQLQGYQKRMPQQLSGGQQQRVALARSLIKRPKLLLLDEPMSALDKQIRQHTQFELVKTLNEVNVTCVMVTHDQEEAMSMANRIAVMNQGVITQVGTPSEIYRYPNSRFNAKFIGMTNVFEGHTTLDEPDCVEVTTPDLTRSIRVSHGVTGPMGMAAGVSVRPEDILLSQAEPSDRHNRHIGKIVSISFLGSHALCQLQVATGRTVLANILMGGLSGNSPGGYRVGDVVWLSWSDFSGVVLTS